MTRFLMPLFVILCSISAHSSSKSYYEVEIMDILRDNDCGTYDVVYPQHIRLRAEGAAEAKNIFKNKYCVALKEKNLTTSGSCALESGKILEFKGLLPVITITKIKLVKRTNMDIHNINSAWDTEDLVTKCK